MGHKYSTTHPPSKWSVKIINAQHESKFFKFLSNQSFSHNVRELNLTRNMLSSNDTTNGYILDLMTIESKVFCRSNLTYDNVGCVTPRYINLLINRRVKGHAAQSYPTKLKESNMCCHEE